MSDYKCKHCGAGMSSYLEWCCGSSRRDNVRSVGCMLAEIEQLRAIVDPLERLLSVGQSVMIEMNGGKVDIELDGGDSYGCGDTLAEALRTAEVNQ